MKPFEFAFLLSRFRENPCNLAELTAILHKEFGLSRQLALATAKEIISLA